MTEKYLANNRPTVAKFIRAIAGAIQYQRAFRQNWIWLITGFLSSRHGTDGLSQGLRTEIQLFF